MLIKDFVKEFKENFTKKVVGKVAVPGCQDTLLQKACDYPLVGTGFHISKGNVIAPIKSSGGEEVVFNIFKVNIKYSYVPISLCSLVEGIELEPSTDVTNITDYENKSTKELIELLKLEI